MEVNNEVKGANDTVVRVRLIEGNEVVPESISLIHWGPCVHFQFNMTRQQAVQLAVLLQEVANQ